jgi:hypothetical protein
MALKPTQSHDLPNKYHGSSKENEKKSASNDTCGRELQNTFIIIKACVSMHAPTKYM